MRRRLGHLDYVKNSFVITSYIIFNIILIYIYLMIGTLTFFNKFLFQIDARKKF